MNWINVENLPSFNQRETPVIVARRCGDGGLRVFGATWLNKCELYNDTKDEEEEWTGFAVDWKHPDFDDYYMKLDGVEWWMPMPTPPE